MRNRGVLIRKAYEASAETASNVADTITVQRFAGAEEAARTWRDLVDSMVAPSQALIGVMAARA